MKIRLIPLLQNFNQYQWIVSWDSIGYESDAYESLISALNRINIFRRKAKQQTINELREHMSD